MRVRSERSAVFDKLHHIDPPVLLHFAQHRMMPTHQFCSCTERQALFLPLAF